MHFISLDWNFKGDTTATTTISTATSNNNKHFNVAADLNYLLMCLV